MFNKLVNLAVEATAWALGFLRLTNAADARAYLEVGGGGGEASVDSVNGKTGAVVLTASDLGAVVSGAPISSFQNDVGYITDADIPGSPVTSVQGQTGNVTVTYASLNDKPTLSTVATSGSYADLSSKPTLGTAAAQNSTAFATAAQGTKADTALQSVPARLNGNRGFNTDPNSDELISISANGLGNPKPALEVWSDDGVTQANISVTTYGVNGGGVMHSRMANGTKAAPTAVTAEQIYGGYGSRPFHTGGDFFASSPVSIHWVAKELQQPTSKGGALRILTTPIGGNDRKINTSFSPDGDLVNSASNLDQNPNSLLRGRGVVVTREGATPSVVQTYQYGGGGNLVSGFLSSLAGGTSAAPTATVANAAVYFGFSGHTGSGYTSSSGLVALKAPSTWTTASTPTRFGVELTPTGSLTRREVFAISDQAFAFFLNCTSAPTGSVGTGGYLYVEGGALKFRGGNGTVTTIAAA
ncbi:hypothetical protein P4_00005 [Xanthomonas phage P4]|uniref:Tail fiber protein n=2 Tax=Pradovirus TaxID=1985733 RepID=A0AAE9VJN5_9CAUD|nr:hypothetical protein F5_00045 [Xanthomonas phage F5]WAX24109.1 hypothetical protein GF2_00043 [Xanthomonas phage GF2]WAX24115.1 hypothetical protein GF1_00002 [Xanthomonas phage GF1]WAX24163.1 hypothetical protein P4_00005 [Xanthomonas phage P4]WAX24249.1 hypothetical protein S3_00044 [Xanthomonas phage S3]